MKSSDSEAEGQLLIDESVQTSRKTNRRKRKGVVNKPSVAKKKSDLKLVVKTTSLQKKPDEKKATADVGETEQKATRTSSRIRTRVRKHSPSPVSVKKEPPKKRLKVKIKNIPKSKKSQKTTIPDEGDKSKPLKLEDGENVDIVSVSDEELSDPQYPPILESPTKKDTPKKSPKKTGKTGIKLKLSLGKVLSAKVADGIVEESVKNISPDPFKENIIKPLIISKQRVSIGVVNNEDVHDTDPTISNFSSKNEGTKFESLSENHKPITLRLSVGKQKSVIMNTGSKNIENPSPKVFPNIRRSWSAVGLKNTEDSTSGSSTSKQQPAITDFNHKKETESKPTETHSSPKKSLTEPYFSIGLQSLLDVVSVELNEQNKSNADNAVANNKKFSSALPPKSKLVHGSNESVSEHEGHLPSLNFPKPALHFSTKKRQRAKSLIHMPILQEPLDALKNSLEEITRPHTDEENSDDDRILTEKERRRHDKKKKLASDFVDPDSILKDDETDISKRAKKKPVIPSPHSMNKSGGLSLLMPQMSSTSNDSNKPKFVPMKSSFQSKPIISKKPKKGMATAKQRLANKLKLGRTHTF